MASKVEIIFGATDDATPVIEKVNGQLGVTDDEISKVSQETQSSKISWTELSSAINLGKEAFQIVGQVMAETVGKFQAYAEQVRALSAISGQNAEDTSRFIQVLDDYQVSAEDATTATKALTKAGLAPNIETLAQLSDQYLSINDAQARNEFVLKNLGKAGLEWNQVLQQGGAALRELAAAQSGGLVLNDQMLARAEKLRLAQDQLNDSWDAFSISVGEKAVPTITNALDIFNKKTEESGMALAVLTFGMDDIYNSIFGVTEATDEAAISISGMTKAQIDAIPTAEELAAAQEEIAKANQKISDTNNGIVNTIQSMQNSDNTYTKNAKALADQRTEINDKMTESRTRNDSKTKGELAEYEKKLADIKQKEADIAAERDKQALQFVSNILLQKLQVDGLTTKEFEEFAKQQEAWGLWSADTVAKAQAAWKETDKITESINNIPSSTYIDFISRYTTIENPTKSDVAPMHGHASGGSFLIPESYGNEGFQLGNGDTASGGERVTITPRGGSQGGAGGVTVNLNIASGGIIADPQEFARQITPALKYALREIGAQ